MKILRKTAKMKPLEKEMDKGLKSKVSKPSPKTLSGKAPKNSGGGLPFFNPYGGKGAA